MIDFIETDITRTSTYSMNVDILTELLQFLKVFTNSEVNKEILDQHLENRKTRDVICARLMKIVGLATVIPLSIFTKLMHQRFVKLKYLESESDTYERESSPSSPVRSLSSPRGGTGRGGVGQHAVDENRDEGASVHLSQSQRKMA